MDKQPLVSIVITAFNGAEFISRAIESCLNQTYKNIEIVFFDDASTDETRKIAEAYSKNEQRFKYVRGESNIGYSRSLAKLPELANGEYVQLLGADDWLSKDYIEMVVKCFNEYPEAACVAPKIVTIREMQDNRFQLIDAFLPNSRKITKNFFIRNVYKTDIGSTYTALALFRREDFLESGSFIREFFMSPPKDIPEDLRKLHFKGHATGTLFLLKTMYKYKYFVTTGEAVYIKTQHFENENKPHNVVIDWTSGGRILKSYYFDRFDFEHLFKNTYRNFWIGYRLFFGAEPFVSMFFLLIKKGFRGSFLKDLQWGDIKMYYSKYSLLEKIVVVLYIPIRLLVRLTSFIKRLFGVSSSRRYDLNIFQKNYFLNKEGYFKL